jgi:hypothetical protein
MNKMTSFFIRWLLVTLLLLQPFHHVHSSQTYNFNLEALGQCGFITLSWNPIPGAAFYWIYRGLSKETIHPMPLTDFPIEASAYVDENDIILEQEYFYYVSAVNADKKEFASSLIISVTPDCDRVSPVPPVPPCKLVLKYQVGNTLYWVNEDSHGPMDTAPIIQHSRMFLVIRYVTNAIQGTQINWEGTERKVTIITRNGSQIELWIGKSQARINGKTVPIDPNNAQVVPVIVNGRTLLPLRFVGENLGAESVEDILWDASTQSVQLFIDDPECDNEGFRYPKATPLQSSFYEFSIEYHTQGDTIPASVRLVLARADNTKTLRLGPSRSPTKDLELELLKAPKPTIEKIPTRFKQAQKYSFRLELIPGRLHFYRFAADEKESHPKEGYLGPVYASLPGALRLRELDFKKIEDGTSLTLEGYYTSEPYPMLVEDYWQIYERSSPSAGILLQLDPSQQIKNGSFVSLKGQKRSQKDKMPLFQTQKIIFEQVIKKDYIPQDEFTLPPLLQTIQKPHRFAIIFNGCIDKAEVKDDSETIQRYYRSRADFTGDVLQTYRICYNMGIMKRNIFVHFGRGDEEIDYICADDGDGNPFDFDWDDTEYRNTMERDAERWWRADDGWRIRQGTQYALFVSILDVYARILSLPPEVTPEVFLFISTHGHATGICTYDGGQISYEALLEEISPIMRNVMTAINARSKIRILNNTCKAGAILPSAQEIFRLSGLDYVQISASSSSSKLSFGQYPERSDTSYASAGGTFGIPFRHSLFEQLSDNANFEVDWKVAHDYASIHDKYSKGLERENDDGTTYLYYSFPQYWHSSDRTLYLNGPAFEDPLSPEDEILVSNCRIGVDTSESNFDICNCSRPTSINQAPKTTFTVVNKGIIPFKVVDVIADESVLSKTTYQDAMIFHDNDYYSCRDIYPININLTYNQSHQFYICLHNGLLNAQPLDENGYMATQNNLPVFIQVPIRVIYESNSTRYSQRAFIQVRVRAECYQISYNTSIKRTETVKGSFSHWENLETKCRVTPSIPGLAEKVIAGPTNSGDFHLSISTDVFEKSRQQKLSHGFMDTFKLQLDFDFMGENKECIRESYDLEGGARIISATLPSKLQGKLEVPFTPYAPTNRLLILIKPEAHSREGYQSILGKHTFQFRVRRMARLTCEYGASEYIESTITIDIEFIEPKD